MPYLQYITSYYSKIVNEPKILKAEAYRCSQGSKSNRRRSVILSTRVRQAQRSNKEVDEQLLKK